MDTKSKIFFLAFILILEGSIFASFYRFVIAKDYIVENQEDCDPTLDKCFIWECDPNAIDESEKCTGDPDNDTWYYKLSMRNAKNVPLCDPDKDENCTPMICEPGEKDCYDVFCSDETNKQYEQEATCNDPVEYVKNNPEEKEDADSEESADEEECAPDDQECLSASEDDESEENMDEDSENVGDEISSGDEYELCQPGVDQECLNDDKAVTPLPAETDIN